MQITGTAKTKNEWRRKVFETIWLLFLPKILKNTNCEFKKPRNFQWETCFSHIQWLVYVASSTWDAEAGGSLFYTFERCRENF